MTTVPDDPRTASPATAQLPQKAFLEQLIAEFEKLVEKITDMKAISPTFKKSLLTELYVCRTILFASFTLGVRAGGLSLFYTPIREIFGYFILFLLTYGLFPIIGLNIAYASFKKHITESEFKVLIITWAFFAGVFSIANNIHYSLGDYGTPTYFMPIIVGLTFNWIGEQYYNDRRRLLTISVGSASVVSLSLLLVTGGLSIATIFSVILCSLNATIALQLLIADVNENGEKVVAPFTHAIGVIMLMINYLIITRIFGKYIENASENHVQNSAPLHSIFSQ
ncbi:unnamed protein product [Caenorhabditis angaria]|uniref:Uncharacterized protein n=1 Tax=Caenorhabditis angaria TaxID=860376 RepID=A0A9P1INE2_9PELO|nr:unnamed protein product [Caenorhabditis angaria]